MSHPRLLLAFALAGAASQAAAMPPNPNHFVAGTVAGVCSFGVEPRNEALNILFRGPATLVVQSSYSFIPGSAIRLSFDDGTELRLASLPDSNSRQLVGQLPADKMAAFSNSKLVTIGSDSIRGPVFRKIGLTDFAAGYAGFSGCAK